MGSRGSVIPSFLARKDSGILPITDERMTRFNISLAEGVDMVMWALGSASGGEIFVPKIPSYRIGDVAEAIAPEAEKTIVGIRPGEKIHEEMITSSDSFSTVDMGRYYAILPPGGKEIVAQYCAANGGKPVEPGFVYNSGTNPDFLSVERLRELIEGEQGRELAAGQMSHKQSCNSVSPRRGNGTHASADLATAMPAGAAAN